MSPNPTETVVFRPNPNNGETFTLTAQLRWVDRVVKLGSFYQPSETAVHVLQQAWQGSLGTVRWEDVPIETETTT